MDRFAVLPGSAPGAKESFMRRIAIVVAIVVVLGLAFVWFSQPKAIPVVLKEVAAGKVEATLANTRAGTVEACLRTKLSTCPLYNSRCV